MRLLEALRRLEERVGSPAGATLCPIATQQEDRSKLTGFVAEFHIEFRMAPPVAQRGLGGKDAAVQIRPFLTRIATDRLGGLVLVLVPTPPDLDPPRGASLRLRTRTTPRNPRNLRRVDARRIG